MLTKRTAEQGPLPDSVTAALIEYACVAKTFFGSLDDFRLQLFVQPLNICSPDKTWVVMAFFACILATYFAVTIMLPCFMLYLAFKAFKNMAKVAPVKAKRN